jgi:hypothetical protein
MSAAPGRATAPARLVGVAVLFILVAVVAGDSSLGNGSNVIFSVVVGFVSARRSTLP